MIVRRVDLTALKAAIEYVEISILECKEGCRAARRPLPDLSMSLRDIVAASVAWGSGMANAQRNLSTLRPVATALYAARAHMRNRVHCAHDGVDLASALELQGVLVAPILDHYTIDVDVQDAEAVPEFEGEAVTKPEGVPVAVVAKENAA